MGVEEFNYKFIKENASAGSWRRGYEYHLKDMVFDTYPEKNFYMGKVKGNFQDHYKTDLIFKKNKVEINALVIVERDNLKKIIIGKNGGMLKRIGTYAREDLGRMV